MKYLINNSTDPYFNMAFDEYCLENLPSGEVFFYLWRNAPSVIIGLNQNAYGEVNLPYLESHGIKLARRVTGGGAVYHDLQNMNYTFVGRGVSPEPFVAALRELGVEAELTGRNDIYVDGRKVSGYARRVWHDREIVHGTMMYDVDIDTLTGVLNVGGSKLESKGIASVRSRVANLRDFLPQFDSLDQVQQALHEILAAGDGEYRLDDAALAQIRKIADERFATWEWIYGHSKEAQFHRSAKLPCGTVEVSFSVDGGLIASIGFDGDFLGGLAVSSLVDMLLGVRYDAACVSSVLNSVNVSSYFDNTSKEDLLTLLFGD